MLFRSIRALTLNHLLAFFPSPVTCSGIEKDFIFVGSANSTGETEIGAGTDADTGHCFKNPNSPNHLSTSLVLL